MILRPPRSISTDKLFAYTNALPICRYGRKPPGGRPSHEKTHPPRPKSIPLQKQRFPVSAGMEHPPAALAPALPLQPPTPGVWQDCPARRTKASPATPRPIPPVAEARACYKFRQDNAADGGHLSRGRDSTSLHNVKTHTPHNKKHQKK